MLRIPELKKNDPVEGLLLVAEKHLQFTREGKPFLRLQLMNRTGRIEGTLWENAEETAQTVFPGRVVRVRGAVVTYQQELKIRIQALNGLGESECNPRDYLPSSSRSPEEMKEELHRLIGTNRNPFLRRLLEDIFRDPKVWDAFSTAPAAKSMHHAYLGGLLEHSLSLARLAQLALKNYPFLDRDLVLTGALLHDLGKAWEFSPEFGFEYTDKGRLLGHILMGLDLLDRKIASIPEFPETLALHLQHLLASHHGELEFGSPKPPMTLEALFLHQLDNLDAKLLGIHEFVRKEAAGQERWTTYHRLHQRYFYIPESPAGPGKTEEDRKKSRPPPSPELFEDPTEDGEEKSA